MKGMAVLAQTKRTTKSKSKTKKSNEPQREYTCTCCGQSWTDPKGHFNQSKSQLFTENDGYINICYDCRDKYYAELIMKLGLTESNAIRRMCQLYDWYYSPRAVEMAKANPMDTSLINVYLGRLNLVTRGISNATYLDTIAEEGGFLDDYKDGTLFLRASENVAEYVENENAPEKVKWSKEDKQNKAFCISTIGYDPFLDCNLTEEDRRKCFNICAGYCDTEGVQEDGHKIQSIIQITFSQLQVSKINEYINEELCKKNPSEDRIQKLTVTKKGLLDAINKMAEANNISSAHSGGSKVGANTLSNKMKEMSQNGFESIQVNLFDIKTCEAMKQIADLSNQSILEQISLDNADYSKIVKEQREMIETLESSNNELTEENRQLKNKLMDLKAGG